ncbi:GatB/YqeY domain-containing protein [Sandarakinorhabdus sp.]|uniref:GatB/YqeY domain-containing protein n=1 Tax=Sandarakinorhabdus sp. TaxID=1916663 RepID=UPI00333E6E25
MTSPTPIRPPIRDAIKAATIDAMKARDSARLGALRLIGAALKNKDIELRTGSAPADDNVLVADVLMKMAKQRRESIEMYDKGGRAELADAERAELAVIEGFLPAQMTEAQADAAIRVLVAEIGATSVKDMGRVMAAMKERYAGQMDMSKANALVKAALS